LFVYDAGMMKLRPLLTFCALVLFAAAQTAPLPAHASGGEKKAEGGEHGGGGHGEGKKDDKKKDEGENDVTGGRFEGDPVYVHIAPMVMPIINDHGVEQLVMLTLDIEVKDFDAANEVRARMPKIRDALMRKLYGGLGSGNLRNGKLIDVTKIKAKALTAITDVVGKDNVRDVLVQGVSQRML
jgi:flagellar basal body-associated protein FliL